LLFRGLDSFAKRSLDLAALGTQGREEDAAEASQFGRAPALFISAYQCLRICYRFKNFGGATILPSFHPSILPSFHPSILPPFHGGKESQREGREGGPHHTHSERECLVIRENLAKQDPSNAAWQSDLAYSY
jgi:hypothetical protein